MGSGRNEFSSFEEVLSMLNVSYDTKRVEIKLDCPECGHHSLCVNLNKNFGKCMHCDKNFNYQTYYMSVCGVDSKQAYKDIMNHYNRTSQREFVPKEVKEEKQSNLLPASDRDNKYREFLSRLTLTDRHKNDLIKRGIKESDVKKFGYKSLVSFRNESDRVHFMKSNNLTGYMGVAGFYKSERGDEEFTFSKDCILVPYLNRNRQICGLQERINDELVKTKDDSKYIWFSSKAKKDGCTSGTMVHYACTFYKDFESNQILPILGKEVRITEGAMKGDLIHYFSKEPVICIPGVKSFGLIAEEAKFLKEHGVETIVDTFDMDYISNDDVARCMERLKEVVLEAGLNYRRDDWDAKFKGYDDYLSNLKNSD